MIFSKFNIFVLYLFSCFIAALSRYLNMVIDMDMLPSQRWHCSLVSFSLFLTALCSTLFILNMTFERFYSIIRPHKAASFNTVKRAKVTILCIVLFSIIYNLPHLFTTAVDGRTCKHYLKYLHLLHVQVYYWLSLFIQFALPFLSLLIMNSVIIHTLRTRSLGTKTRSEGQGQTFKVKSQEKQIYIMLLLVTFGFMILTTPTYIVIYYVSFWYYQASAQDLALYYLLYNVAQKTYYTNYALNFFLYVISSQKFRSDLVGLFKCKQDNLNSPSPNSASSNISSNASTVNLINQ